MFIAQVCVILMLMVCHGYLNYQMFVTENIYMLSRSRVFVMYIMYIFYLSNVSLFLRMLLIIHVNPNYQTFKSWTLEGSNAGIGTFAIAFCRSRQGVPPTKENLSNNNSPFHTAMLRNVDEFYIKNAFFSEKLETENLSSRNIKHHLLHSCRKSVSKYCKPTFIPKLKKITTFARTSLTLIFPVANQLFYEVLTAWRMLDRKHHSPLTILSEQSQNKVAANNVKLIRYQFRCNRKAFRLIKSLQWCSCRKKLEIRKRIVKALKEPKTKTECTEIEPNPSKDRVCLVEIIFVLKWIYKI
jgi:hypothetical protein